ncbi:MAG: T9SS type A sorting domain-containing protein [Bacteroidota bacterium]
MIKSATSCGLLALVLLLAGGAAWAQGSIDDDFIVFVNGPNVVIPESDLATVNDPLEPTSGNKVARFDYADFSSVRVVGWQRDLGTDLSALISDDAAGAQYNLYVRVLSGPENLGKAVGLVFFDSTTDPALSREEIEGGAEADLEFRAFWPFPDEAHDGTWKDYAIPLPPSTIAALDSAKVGKDVDGNDLGFEFDPLAANWSYTGGWNNGGSYGYGEPGGFSPASTDPLFEEFGWAATHAFAVFFDNNQGGETVYLDDVYIATEPLDLSIAENPPAPMSGVSFDATGRTNTVSWTPNTDFGGYSVYASDSPITDPAAGGVVKLGSFAFDAAAFALEHRYELPHPSLGQEPLYYAVTSLSQFGVENFDVSSSSGSVTNADLDQQPFIIGLTDDEANTIFTNIANGIVSDAGFPEGYPTFFIDNRHSQISEPPGSELPADSDISARVRLAYSSFNELYVYAEFTDDATQFGLEGVNNGGDAWQFDSFEIGWGNYDVNDVPGGSTIVGSPHVDMQRGEFADYQLRLAPLQDGAGEIVTTATQVDWSLFGPPQNGITISEKTDTGWALLSVIGLAGIQADGDAVLPPPGADEIRYVPMELSVNDADNGESNRENQISWGLKPNHTNQWWNTPAQWPTVALAGRNTAMPVAGEDDAQVATFALEANYPNPFSQATHIAYTLPEAAEVTVEVFDVLGRRVAVLVDGARVAGAHTATLDAQGLASGLYLYRLTAGKRTAVEQMMVIK